MSKYLNVFSSVQKNKIEQKLGKTRQNIKSSIYEDVSVEDYTNKTFKIRRKLR